MSSRDLIELSLEVLNISGIISINQSKRSKFKTAVSILMLVHMIAELTLQLTLNGKGWESVEGLVVCAAMSQALFKIIYVVLNNGELMLLLEEMKLFWPWNNLEVVFKQKLEHLVSPLRSSVKVFYMGSVVTLTLYYIRPLLGSTRSLPFDTYHPTDINTGFVYQTMYIVQIVEGIIAYIGMVGFDSLFISLIINIVCELRIIKLRLASIPVMDNNIFDEVKQLVEHHNLVLRCMKLLNKFCSGLLLMQFSSSTIFLCTGLFSMVISGFPPDLEHLSKYVSFLSVSFIQLSVYCVVGAYVTTESEEVSNAVYESHWWAAPQCQLRKSCLLIMQRASKTETLLAGGVFALNLENFTKILRFAFSFFSLAQAMFTKAQQK